MVLADWPVRRAPNEGCVGYGRRSLRSIEALARCAFPGPQSPRRQILDALTIEEEELRQLLWEILAGWCKALRRPGFGVVLRAATKAAKRKALLDKQLGYGWSSSTLRSGHSHIRAMYAVVGALRSVGDPLFSGTRGRPDGVCRRRSSLRPQSRRPARAAGLLRARAPSRSSTQASGPRGHRR